MVFCERIPMCIFSFNLLPLLCSSVCSVPSCVMLAKLLISVVSFSLLRYFINFIRLLVCSGHFFTALASVLFPSLLTLLSYAYLNGVDVIGRAFCFHCRRWRRAVTDFVVLVPCLITALPLGVCSSVVCQSEKSRRCKHRKFFWASTFTFTHVCHSFECS